MKDKPPRVSANEKKLAAAILGGIGGRKKSADKTAACRANASLPRPNGRKPRKPRAPKGRPNRAPARKGAKK